MHELTELITAVAALGAVAVSVWNSIKIRDVHVSLNSRLSQLVLASEKAARANGVVQGRKDMQDEHDAAGH